MTRALIAAALALTVAAPAFADNHNKTVVDVAVGSADHTTLVQAVQAAGLAETLSGEGPFTVFAPTNEAFAAVPAEALADLLKPENKETLTKVLTCHAVGANVMAADVGKLITDGGGSHVIDTLGGCKITAAMDGDKVTLTDENGTVANVTAADLAASNGVIHVIDAVLMPKM